MGEKDACLQSPDEREFCHVTLIFYGSWVAPIVRILVSTADDKHMCIVIVPFYITSRNIAQLQ